MKNHSYGARHHGHGSIRKELKQVKKLLKKVLDEQAHERSLRNIRAKPIIPILPSRTCLPRF